MDSQKPEEQPNNESGEPKEQISPGVTKLDVPVSPPSDNKPDEHKKHWIDYAKFLLELLGFFVLCIYACFTIGIYRANQKAANAASEALIEVRKQTGFAATSAKAAQDNVSAVLLQIRQDQRPWIKIGFPPTGQSVDPSKPMASLNLESGKPIMVPLRLINVGKTPAKAVAADVIVEIVRRNEKVRFPVEPGEKRLPTIRVAGARITAGIIFPDQFTERSVPRAGRVGHVLAPTPLTLKEAMDIRDGVALIYLCGRIDYKDTFGVAHWTKFCRSLSDEPENPECPKYNDTDSN
jgi:hypothetical protein